MEAEKIYENIRKLNFTAIDFETANEQRASVCSVGIVKVRNGEIVQEDYWLVRPKELRFSEYNSRIHGITLEDVKDAPEFNSLWDRINSRFSDEILLAHNTDFDIDVLRKTLNSYNLSPPSMRYACTQKLAQYAFKDLSNYRLSDVAAYLGIGLDHHNSLSDARAAATIGIRAFPLIEHYIFMHKNAELTHPISKKPSSSKRSSLGNGDKRVNSALLKPNLEAAEVNNPFYNKKVVFTGDLQTISRTKAAAIIQAMGADINVSISNRTNVVILGENPGPSKLKKIEELRISGSEIKSMEEQEFLSLIKQESKI